MLNPQKAAEREALLKRLRTAYAELAEHERNLLEGEARLPVEEQLKLYLLRLSRTFLNSRSSYTIRR